MPSNTKGEDALTNEDDDRFRGSEYLAERVLVSLTVEDHNLRGTL